MKVDNTRSKYLNAIPELKEEFGYANNWGVPKINKVVINSGIGRFIKEGEKLKEVVESITAITGQKPVQTKAKKAISGFKTRQGQPVGVSVTLRGKKMWNFLDRLTHIAFPRTRDFQGIKNSTVDKYGNVSIGIKEQIVFPEISPEAANVLFGFQINISTTAMNKEEAEELMRKIGLPINKK